MAINHLIELKKLGQSTWLDNIRRGHILSGGLKKLIDEDGLTGETSNPTIFEKAFTAGDDYADAIAELIAQGKSAFEIYDTLAIEDVRMACDVFRPVFDATNGNDGFVSLEVTPTIAYDTHKTIAEAKRLFKAVRRPNVMIKIPGTQEGLPAIEQCLYDGLNINITLLFSLKAYEQVAWAYIRALERRAQEGKRIDNISSVASFFVSRIDTLADKILQDKIRATNDPAEKARLEALGGKVAIANAKRAYQLFKQIFGDPRFIALQAQGARVQRPLWASTSTKNPAYKDTIYVDSLIAPNTINTMPFETIDAFREHGTPRISIEDDLAGAQHTLAELNALGISLDAITDQVLQEGVVKFVQPFEQLLASIQKKIVPAIALRQAEALGDYADAINENVAAAEQNDVAGRVWRKDATLWKTEPEHIAEISIRLGWLDVVTQMRQHLAELKNFGEEIRQAGFKTIVLCGMGGSSLGVETLRDVIGSAKGFPALRVLDTTDPATVRALDRKIDARKTLFVIASKSGGTTETLSHYKYFSAQAPAQNFIAITDPGSGLQKLAIEKNFRRVFENPPAIGGRYSVLSYFGLVPAALMGIDLEKLLTRADEMMQACAADVPAETNPGEWLGVVLATLAQRGRDKITFVTSKELATFGAWAEQLIAESTGKEDKGLVPIDGEKLGKPASYDTDRVFVYLQLGTARQASIDKALTALEKIGHPVVQFSLRDVYDIGAEFFRWEFAIAVAGALIGIDAFDQPNVEEAKKNARNILSGNPTAPTPIWENKKFAVYATVPLVANNFKTAVQAFLELARPGDYLALMAYLPNTSANNRAMRLMRTLARDTLNIATTSGYGPRFLHSTGQLHKGGANNILALQFTTAHKIDAAIPGEPYTFGKLIDAQAQGDWTALQNRQRRALRIHLKPGATLVDVAQTFQSALRRSRKNQRGK